MKCEVTQVSIWWRFQGRRAMYRKRWALFKLEDITLQSIVRRIFSRHFIFPVSSQYTSHYQKLLMGRLNVIKRLIFWKQCLITSMKKEEWFCIFKHCLQVNLTWAVCEILGSICSDWNQWTREEETNSNWLVHLYQKSLVGRRADGTPLPGSLQGQLLEILLIRWKNKTIF